MQAMTSVQKRDHDLSQKELDDKMIEGYCYMMTVNERKEVANAEMRH